MTAPARGLRLPAALLAALPALLIAGTCGEAPPGANAARSAAPTPATPPADQDPIRQDSAAPTPRVRLCLSGFLDGRLEPCGCAAAQLGGLPRRVFHLNRQDAYDLRIEGGNLIKDGSPLDAEKLQTALTILKNAKYETFALGPTDLRLPLAELARQFESWTLRPIASDLELPEEFAAGFCAFVEHRLPQVTVRIASMVHHLPDPAPAGVALIDRDAAWKRALEGAADTDYRVLLVHGDRDTTLGYAALRPRPDLIVGITEEVAEAPARASEQDGVPVVFPGVRGRMLLDVTLTRAADGPQITRYNVVRLEGSPSNKGALEDEMAKQILLGHRHQVQGLEIREKMADREATANGWTYVGSKACQTCHTEAYAAWEASGHAKAWDTLEAAEKDPKRYGWPVTHYPDCVGCHVVGYGDKTGFVNPAKTPLLRGVGCESCHGPGGQHTFVAPTKATIHRGGVVDCLKCHDFEQSPNFDYASRWKTIEHYLNK